MNNTNKTKAYVLQDEGIQEQVDNFIEYLKKRKGYAKKTTSSYAVSLYDFYTVAKVGKAEDIKLEHVDKWSTALSKRGLKNKSQNHHLIALRNFLKWCARNDIKSFYYDKIELASEKNESKITELLTRDELKTLLDVDLTSEKVKNKDYRDKAILELLFSTGLRVSELVGLNLGQIDFGKKQFPVKGKGGKIRVVFLSQRAVDALWNYRDWFRNWLTKDGPLFIRLNKNNKGSERLTVRSVQQMIKERADWVGIKKKVTPHLIRHQFATELLKRGADINTVKDILGHNSLLTTQKYLHLANGDLEQAHKKFHVHPLDDEAEGDKINTDGKKGKKH